MLLNDIFRLVLVSGEAEILSEANNDWVTILPLLQPPKYISI